MIRINLFPQKYNGINPILFKKEMLFIKPILQIFTVFSTAVLLSVCCFADVIFRSDGITDLSAVSLLLDNAEQITVKKAPAAGQGSLFCQGAELSDNDTFYQREMDSLVFVPFCEQYFCSIELQPQGESRPLSITVTDQDCKFSSYSLEAGEYCWAWAKSGYFSHIRDTAPAISEHL